MEYYIETNSFAAPFCSDTSYSYVDGDTPQEALAVTAKEYKHPCGLYAAAAYTSADAKNKGERPLAKWLCNLEQEKQRATKGLGAYTYYSSRDDEFEIDGVLHKVKHPKQGCVIA